MSNIEEIIKEDLSDSLIGDSEISSNNKLNDSKIKSSKIKEKIDKENFKRFEFEKKESQKTSKKIRSKRGRDKDIQYYTVRKINSIVTEKKRINEKITFENFSRSKSNVDIGFKQANSYYNDSKNFRSLKFDNNKNNNIIDCENKNRTSFKSNDVVDINFIRKDDKKFENESSNKSNLFNGSYILDSSVVSERNEKLKNLDNQSNIIRNTNDIDIKEKKIFNLNFNLKGNNKNINIENFDKVQDMMEEEISDQKFEQNDINNKNDLVKKNSKIFYKKLNFAKFDELDSKNLINNSNSSDESY